MVKFLTMWICLLHHILWCLFLRFSVATSCTCADKVCLHWVPVCTAISSVTPSTFDFHVKSSFTALCVYVSLSYLLAIVVKCRWGSSMEGQEACGLMWPYDRDRHQSLTELKEVAGLDTDHWTYLLLDIVTYGLGPSWWISTVCIGSKVISHSDWHFTSVWGNWCYLTNLWIVECVHVGIMWDEGCLQLQEVNYMGITCSIQTSSFS